ncbi:hypothetical protein C8R45DRAFT_1078539 [Mycena sanguinolenta]|nr:hypothetical protein C8R45DRAFT_1078539 [Mycena sanguinolenta]
MFQITSRITALGPGCEQEIGKKTTRISGPDDERLDKKMDRGFKDALWCSRVFLGEEYRLAYALEHRQEYIRPAEKQKRRVRKIKSVPARAKDEGFPPSSGSPATLAGKMEVRFLRVNDERARWTWPAGSRDRRQARPDYPMNKDCVNFEACQPLKNTEGDGRGWATNRKTKLARPGEVAQRRWTKSKQVRWSKSTWVLTRTDEKSLVLAIEDATRSALDFLFFEIRRQRQERRSGDWAGGTAKEAGSPKREAGRCGEWGRIVAASMGSGPRALVPTARGRTTAVTSRAREGAGADTDADVPSRTESVCGCAAA